MADKIIVDTRKFTPAADLMASSKLVQDAKSKAYTIDSNALAKGEEILMSKSEFDGGMKDIKGVPVTITPDGKQPVFPDIGAEELKPIEDVKTK